MGQSQCPENLPVFGGDRSAITHHKRSQESPRHRFRDRCVDIGCESFPPRSQPARGDMSIGDAMIQLGQNVGMNVIAEGVETQSQLDVLCRFGCHFAQGYLFAKPLPANDATDWLKAQSGKPAPA